MTFVARNPNLAVFSVGYSVFVASLAAWSAPLAGVVGGAILMAAAVYPLVIVRNR